MKPENQAVVDGIAKEVKSLTITQRRAFLRAMRNPYFFRFAFCLAGANERDSQLAYRFLRGLTDRKETQT